MASLFSNDPAAKPPPPRYGVERIEQEIEHLKNQPSVRSGGRRSLSYAQWISTIGVCALLWLYFMDPILYSFNKRDAMRTYLYLHSFGSEDKAVALAATGILSEREVNDLNREQGNFQDYFSAPELGTQEADKIIRFMNGLHYLRTGQYDKLDRIGKLRYELFVRWGLLTPTSWSELNPTTYSS